MTTRTVLISALLMTTALSVPLEFARGDGARGSSRADNDVRVRLKVRGKRKAQVRVRVKVRNRGRSDQPAVQVALHDGNVDAPLWTTELSLDAGKRKRFRVRLDREDVGDLLTASVVLPGRDDERPQDNGDSETTLPGGQGGPGAAERGRDIYVPLCSSCHGPSGRGGTADENIAKESWREFVEAFREGEDGMPTYPELTASDARDIVAYLRNPDAVEPTEPVDPPPVDPPPPGTSPTYTTHVKPILDARCVSCHGASFAAAGIALHDYASASQSAAASLASIDAGRMPTNGALAPADVETFRRWIEGGKPE